MGVCGHGCAPAHGTLALQCSQALGWGLGLSVPRVPAPKWLWPAQAAFWGCGLT